MAAWLHLGFMSASRTIVACLALMAPLLAIRTPIVNLSSYLGVADCDGVAIGSNGDAYLACHSPYDRLPIGVKPSKQTGENFDAYVLRLNPQTGKLIYATRIGGSDYDEASRIKVDQHG